MKARAASLPALWPLLLAVAIGGCVSKDKSDLEQWVGEVLARPGGRIDPLPEIKPYERYLYQAAEANKPDPFATFEDTRAEPTATTRPGLVRQSPPSPGATIR